MSVEMKSRRRVPGATGVRRLVLAVAVLAPWLFGAPAAAQDSPLDGASPSGSGMPARDLIRDVLSWGMYVGLGACGAAILFGGATWAGFGSASAGRAVHGKTYVIAGLIGAAVIGIAPTAVNMLFDAGSS